MEKLFPLRDLGERESYTILVNLVGRDTAREMKVTAEKESFKGTTITWRLVLSHLLDAHSGLSIPSSMIINEDWLEAYNWVQSVAKKEGWYMDLHSENWMFRRTPYGPQLVIIDPFSWRRISF